MKPTNRCESCRGKIVDRKVRLDYRYLDRLLIIEDVPAGVCSRCGEREFRDDVVADLETIARQRTKIRKRISVPVTRYRRPARSIAG